jgi:hypothetical protein
MIEQYDELPHDRGSSYFLRFSLSEQTLMKDDMGGVVRSE